MVLLFKLLGFCIGVFVIVPLSILVCLPYLLAASMADKEEYWSSFWWRTKRIAAAAATVGGIIGVCLVPWK
jgi:ABC-type sulfate transport system permease component